MATLKLTLAISPKSALLRRVLLPAHRGVEDHLIGLRQRPLLLSTWDHFHQNSKHSCDGKWDKSPSVVARTPQAVAVAVTNTQGFRRSSRNSCVGGRGTDAEGNFREIIISFWGSGVVESASS